MTKQKQSEENSWLKGRHDLEDEQLSILFLLVQEKVNEQGKIFLI